MASTASMMRWRAESVPMVMSVPQKSLSMEPTMPTMFRWELALLSSSVISPAGNHYSLTHLCQAITRLYTGEGDKRLAILWTASNTHEEVLPQETHAHTNTDTLITLKHTHQPKHLHTPKHTQNTLKRSVHTLPICTFTNTHTHIHPPKHTPANPSTHTPGKQ